MSYNTKKQAFGTLTKGQFNIFLNDKRVASNTLLLLKLPDGGCLPCYLAYTTIKISQLPIFYFSICTENGEDEARFTPPADALFRWPKKEEMKKKKKKVRRTA